MIWPHSSLPDWIFSHLSPLTHSSLATPVSAFLLTPEAYCCLGASVPAVCPAYNILLSETFIQMPSFLMTFFKMAIFLLPALAFSIPFFSDLLFSIAHITFVI